MDTIFGPHHEFVEILNAFPVLKERLEELHINVSEIKEGETVLDYFLRKSYSDAEIEIFIKKINTDLNYYLKKGEFPKVALTSVREALGTHESEFVEKEKENIEEFEEEE